MGSNFFAQSAFASILLVGASASAATGAASLDSLLAAGYEIKSVNDLSDSATSQLYSGQNLPPQTIVTLQKGSSIAVCNMATANWINLNDASFTSAERCSTR